MGGFFKSTKLLAILWLALALSAVSAAQADMFVYRSADGSLHFSDRQKSEKWQLYKEADSSGEEDTDLHMDALDHLELVQHVQRLSKKHHIDTDLIRAVIKVESNYNPLAVSRKGAMGLMQLMPDTAKSMNVPDAYEPLDNVEGGVKYLRYLVDRFGGRMVHALAAYNAGPNAVERFGGIPPYPETQDYVRKVIQYYKAYQAQAKATAAAKGKVRQRREPVMLTSSADAF